MTSQNGHVADRDMSSHYYKIKNQKNYGKFLISLVFLPRVTIIKILITFAYSSAPFFPLFFPIPGYIIRAIENILEIIFLKIDLSGFFLQGTEKIVRVIGVFELSGFELSGVF